MVRFITKAQVVKAAERTKLHSIDKLVKEMSELESNKIQLGRFKEAARKTECECGITINKGETQCRTCKQEEVQVKAAKLATERWVKLTTVLNKSTDYEWVYKEGYGQGIKTKIGNVNFSLSEWFINRHGYRCNNSMDGFKLEAEYGDNFKTRTYKHEWEKILVLPEKIAKVLDTFKEAYEAKQKMKDEKESTATEIKFNIIKNLKGMITKGSYDGSLEIKAHYYRHGSRNGGYTEDGSYDVELTNGMKVNTNDGITFNTTVSFYKDGLNAEAIKKFAEAVDDFKK